MVIPNFPEIGKFRPAIGLLISALPGDFLPIFRFRGSLLTTPWFFRGDCP